MTIKSNDDEALLVLKNETTKQETSAKKTQTSLPSFALDAEQIGDWELNLKSGKTKRSLRHDQCFGYSELLTDWTYAVFLDHLHPEDHERVNHVFKTAIASEHVYEVDFRVTWPDGSLHWLLSRACIVRDTMGQPITVSGVLIDITLQKLAQQKLEHLAMIVEKVTTPVMTTDPAGNIDWANNAFLAMTGYTQTEVIGKQPGQLLQGPDSCKATIAIMHNAQKERKGFNIEILNYRKNGEKFWQHIKADPIQEDTNEGVSYIAVQSDITVRKHLEDELWQKANFDTLTKLPNRRLFWDRLNSALVQSQRTKNIAALLFIDLDRFKEINDFKGHDYGDTVLQEVAARIKSAIRASDTAARMGGDEFAVILSELPDSKTVDQVARKILHVLSQSISIQDIPFTVSASIGVALFPEDADSSGRLFRHADQAMYQAKTAGRNQLAYFTASMQERSGRRLTIGHELRQAITKNELLVYFQPIIDLKTTRIVKAEALLRWKHPTLGEVKPAEFIPLAEELGLIDEIGEWVFKQAAFWSKTWRTYCKRPFQVSVNKSALQFLSHHHAQSWPELLQKWKIPGANISIEITEGVLLKDSSTVMKKLSDYRAAGIEIALDDFGTGYSSMTYLQKFNIDYLKIDQSFVRNIATEQSHVIVEAIIAMGHKLGLKIIAEGIESEQQLRILIEAGCDFGQGYLFSHALPPKEFTKLLDV